MSIEKPETFFRIFLDILRNSVIIFLKMWPTLPKKSTLESNHTSIAAALKREEKR